MINVEESPCHDLKIRRASLSDVHAFVDICRTAFPRNPRWQGLRSLARRWWQTALSSSGTETWIAQIDGEVLAVCLLVTDETRWVQDKARQSRPLALRLVSAASCPVLTGAKILRALKNNMNSHQALPPASSDRKVQTRTWIELIAVAARHRRRGLAKCLLRHCEARTKALGKEAICLRVHKANEAAQGLYETTGYQKVNVNGLDTIYSKLIS